jgi:hypothetical protein
MQFVFNAVDRQLTHSARLQVNQKFFWVKKKVMNHAAESAILVLVKDQPH